jgi:hypothetical protein
MPARTFECKRKSSNRWRVPVANIHALAEVYDNCYIAHRPAQKITALVDDGLLDASEENFAATGKPCIVLT